jgi:hypothetical protein
VLRVTPQPETFDLGAPPKPIETLVVRERTRQSSLGAAAPAQHLYPPDKGWVRMDPAVPFDSISLLDLTVLVNDPAELATMLTRLVDEDANDPTGRAAALEQRYADIVMLTGALDPRLARLLFSKLARAVLDLDANRRRSLLRRVVLPNLLDGRVDGEAVLAEFPDVELAQALCLLLDLEAAAPQLLPVALDRLRLTSERRAALAPLLETGLKDRGALAETTGQSSTADLERHASKLTRIDANAATAFDQFTAFDLSISDQTAAAIAAARDVITHADHCEAQLACASRLVVVEPNPALAAAVLARAVPAIRSLASDARWDDVTRWAGKFAAVAADLEPARPDVAKAVTDALQQACDRDFVVRLAGMCSTEAGTPGAAPIVAALGPALVPAWLDALETAADRPLVRALTPVLSRYAIADRIPALSVESKRVAVGVLGFAGAGYETLIAEQTGTGDERTSREALRALARVGSPKAAALIVAQLEQGPAMVQPAAEEALWRLPAPVLLAKAHELLGSRHFVTRHPQVAARLLDRAAQGAVTGLGPVLENLRSLRFYFWSPAVARVGARARTMERKASAERTIRQ